MLQWLMVSFLILDEAILLIVLWVLLRAYLKVDTRIRIPKIRVSKSMVGIPSEEDVLSEEERIEMEWERERGLSEEDEE